MKLKNVQKQEWGCIQGQVMDVDIPDNYIIEVDESYYDEDWSCEYKTVLKRWWLFLWLIKTPIQVAGVTTITRIKGTLYTVYSSDMENKKSYFMKSPDED